MRRDICLLGLFLLFSFFFSFPFVKANRPLADKVFVIDPGHGGVDPGSVVDFVYEKDLNLKISRALKSELSDLGATVYLTRDGDYDLSTPGVYMRKKSDFDHRISFINQSQANYYLSIHLNYLNDSSYFGPQVFYSLAREENKNLALRMQRVLNQELKTSRESKKMASTLYMYQKLKVPGVLIECGFLSNSKERKLLQQEKYVKNLAQVIAKSFLP